MHWKERNIYTKQQPFDWKDPITFQRSLHLLSGWVLKLGLECAIWNDLHYYREMVCGYHLLH